MKFVIFIIIKNGPIFLLRKVEISFVKSRQLELSTFDK